MANARSSKFMQPGASIDEEKDPMAAKRLKESPKDNVDGPDRFSDLPEPIIHHIMSFLPTVDVARTTNLSKRFFSLWASFPIFDFDQNLFHRKPSGPEAYVFNRSSRPFLDYVCRSISHRELVSDLEKFRIKVNMLMNPHDYPLLYCAIIGFALENCVKEMDLDIVHSANKYNLPENFSSKSIKVLRLKHFELNPNDLIQTCPSMESLTIDQCVLLSGVRFCSTKLKHVDLDKCSGFSSIELMTPSLQSFSYEEDYGEACTNIDIVACKLLKNLSLTEAHIADEWLKSQVSVLLNVENLKLQRCSQLRKIEICHGRLQSLELFDCNNLVEAKVDTPELLSFEFRGSVISLRVMKCRSLCNSTLRLTFNFGEPNDWFQRLRHMLSFFEQFQSLTLICKPSKKRIFQIDPSDERIPSLHDLELMKMQILFSQKIHSQKKIRSHPVDSSLWHSPHPDALSFSPGKAIQFQYEKGLQNDMYPLCCVQQPGKCWRHFLEKVQFHNFEAINERDRLLKYVTENTKRDC